MIPNRILAQKTDHSEAIDLSALLHAAVARDLIEAVVAVFTELFVRAFGANWCLVGWAKQTNWITGFEGSFENLSSEGGFAFGDFITGVVDICVLLVVFLALTRSTVVVDFIRVWDTSLRVWDINVCVVVLLLLVMIAHNDGVGASDDVATNSGYQLRMSAVTYHLNTFVPSLPIDETVVAVNVCQSTLWITFVKSE